MPKNLVEFITGLAKKSGLKMDDEKIVAFLATDGLDKIEIPDEVIALDNKLISVQDAMNNHPDISRHYKGITLKPVDKKIENLVAEFGLDKDAAAEIIGETNSYERIQLFAKAIREHEIKKGFTDKDAQKKFQQTIDALQTELRNQKAAAEQQKTGYDKSIKDFKLDHAKSLLFSDYKTVYDELPSDVKVQTLSILLNKRLAEKDAVIDFDEGGSLVLKKKDGTTYYSENNTPVTHKQFVEQILSDNKIIKVNVPGNGNGNNTSNTGQNQNRQPANGGGNDNGNGNSNQNTGRAILSQINKQAMTDMQNATSPI